MKEATQTRKALEKRTSRAIPTRLLKCFPHPLIRAYLTLSLASTTSSGPFNPFGVYLCVGETAVRFTTVLKVGPITTNLISPFSPRRSPLQCTSRFATHGSNCVRPETSHSFTHSCTLKQSLGRRHSHTLLLFVSFHGLELISYLSFYPAQRRRRLH